MPRTGGLEALRLLKREMLSTHVVMVSTALEPEVRDEALGAGADACLEKDVDLWSALSRFVPDLVPELPG